MCLVQLVVNLVELVGPGEIGTRAEDTSEDLTVNRHAERIIRSLMLARALWSHYSLLPCTP